jgi:hypothetical protein
MRDIISFDKADWHTDGTAEENLDFEQAFVHTGMYLGWIIDRELYSEEFAETHKKAIVRYRARKMTGPTVYASIGVTFASHMLNDEGVAFTKAYYGLEKSRYLVDYEKLLTVDLPSTYHVKDTWENYELLKPVIDKRFAAWREEGKPV